jgi:hypothetical protein
MSKLSNAPPRQLAGTRLKPCLFLSRLERHGGRRYRYRIDNV